MNLVCRVVVLSVAVVVSIGLTAQEAKIINYNNDKEVKLLFDYYHHNLPGTKVGNHIVTGSWLDSDGRYGWNDFVHTNTFDHAYTILSKEYSISMSRSPFNKQLLKGFDGVVIFAADNPMLIPNAKSISDQEIAALTNFVEKGGSLMLMLNAIEKKRFNESFETKQVEKLLRGFGLMWNEDDTHYSDNTIPVGHPYFYDVPVFHYGAGCTISILPEAERPQILLNVYSDSTYSDRSVSGAGIVMVRRGKGKFILVGDAGSWTGNISRPWADNGRMLKQLFRYMKADRGVRPAVYTPDKLLHYDVTIAGLQAVPAANSLSGILLPKHHVFSPRPTTTMPYFEAAASIAMTGYLDTMLKAFNANIEVDNFRWFEQPAQNNAGQKISALISRQGKLAEVNATGQYAQWLAPDISILSALLPNDGLKAGDKWQSVESIRIPSFRGTDLPFVKMQEIDILYAKDTILMGKKCRYLESSDEVWLSDWNIKVEDILPEEEIKQAGGINYRYLHDRGGKLLFKREQWVDEMTGIVLQARLQTRIITWIQDKRKRVAQSNADKDNETIASLASIITFRLKN